MAVVEKNARGKIPPAIAAIQAAGGVEVRDRHGVRPVPVDRLRALSHDTVLAIAEKFDSQTVSDLFEDLCKAECVTKGGQLIADNRTRLATLALALSYIVGRPIERQEIVTVSLDADSANGLRDRLKNSPAMRDALRGMLAELDAVDVEVTTS